jgi:hypothetical protein
MSYADQFKDYLKQSAVGLAAIFGVAGCSQMPVNNRTPQEQFCHDQAGGNWQNAAINAATGAGAGALGGLIIGGGDGAAKGAGAGAGAGVLYNEYKYKQAYDACMRQQQPDRAVPQSAPASSPGQYEQKSPGAGKSPSPRRPGGARRAPAGEGSGPSHDIH